jgi:hypothetical protein
MKRKAVPQHLKESGKTLKRRASVSSLKIEGSKAAASAVRGHGNAGAHESKHRLENSGNSSSALVRAVGVVGSGEISPSGGGTFSSGSSGSPTVASPLGSAPSVSAATGTPTGSSNNGGSITTGLGPIRRPLMIGPPVAPPLVSAGSARMLTGKDNFGVELSSRSGVTSTSPHPHPSSRYEVPGVVHEH